MTPNEGTGSDGQLTTISASSYETLAADHPLTFPAPFGDRPDGDAFVAEWRLIQYVFDLRDPASFPPLGGHIPATDQTVLRRYVSSASDLADSKYLKHPIQFSFSYDERSESISVTNDVFPPKENIVGFSTSFRQFYSNEEDASFNKVQWILREANDRAVDDHSDTRKQQLAEWGKGVQGLRRCQLRVLVGKQLIREKRMPDPGSLPGEEWKPDELIDLYNYGDYIHWKKRRESLAAFSNDPFLSTLLEDNLRESVVGLANVFLGFSILVESALAPNAN